MSVAKVIFSKIIIAGVEVWAPHWGCDQGDQRMAVPSSDAIHQTAEHDYNNCHSAIERAEAERA